ncbi:MAG: hypothetical protein JNJ56_13625 [Ignavibacteria bacterium]|nr:hypothetical protein [Ignavibacteria bacterium]
MKITIFLLIVLSVIYSCGIQESNKYLPDISDANIVKFSYKTDFDSAGKIIIKNVEIRDPGKVAQIKKVITYEPFDYVYCVSSGTVSFYRDSTMLAEMVFNTTLDLLHIACNYNGKLVAIKLSEENAVFLDSFKN